jgi:hypothetical protein
MMLDLGGMMIGARRWCESQHVAGIDELWSAAREHRAFQQRSNQLAVAAKTAARRAAGDRAVAVARRSTPP